MVRRTDFGWGMGARSAPLSADGALCYGAEELYINAVLGQSFTESSPFRSWAAPHPLRCSNHLTGACENALERGGHLSGPVRGERID